METLNVLWPILVGGLTVPLAQWIKTKIPADVPIMSAVIVAVLNLGVMAILWQIFVPTMAFAELVPLALKAQVAGQMVHAAVKTKKKLTIGG